MRWFGVIIELPTNSKKDITDGGSGDDTPFGGGGNSGDDGNEGA